MKTSIEMRTRLKQTTPRRVLVADDDPVTTHLLAAIIKQQDYEVVVARDGREAYRILRTDSQFSAALLDMSMPFLQGLDLIRYMRSEKRLMRIPIMMISAEQDIRLMASSFAAGASAFLAKPFTPDRVQSALRMLLGTQSVHLNAA